MSDGGRFSDLAGQAAVRQAVEASPRVERVITAALIVGGALLLARYPVVRRTVFRAGRQVIVVGLPWLLRRQIKQAWQAASAIEPASPPPGANAAQGT